MGNLAIIPARSGSKGKKKKNIKCIFGKPLLAYAIESAQSSGCFDEIMVSTDSEKYASVARQHHASVPFLRSAQNSNDTASSWDVVYEVLGKYRERGMQFHTFCLLQPTSPLRTGMDIQNAYEVFERKHAVSVASVCECEHSPSWTGVLNDTHSLEGFIGKDMAIRRQEQNTYYRLNGAIYIMEVNEFMKGQNLFGMNSFAYIMRKERSIDIDDAYDFFLAETLIGKDM